MKFENNLDRAKQLREFDQAPDAAWFGQETVAAIRCCSVATIERDRWNGGGVPFVKCGRSVRYSKRAILDWLSKYDYFQSTTEIQNIKKRGK